MWHRIKLIKIHTTVHNVVAWIWWCNLSCISLLSPLISSFLNLNFKKRHANRCSKCMMHIELPHAYLIKLKSKKKEVLILFTIKESRQMKCTVKWCSVIMIRRHTVIVYVPYKFIMPYSCLDSFQFFSTHSFCHFPSSVNDNNNKKWIAAICMKLCDVFHLQTQILHQ